MSFLFVWNNGKLSKLDMLRLGLGELTEMYRLQIPTGNPNMPDEVQQAKRIKYTIELKADLGDREEEFDLEEGYIQQQGPPL